MLFTFADAHIYKHAIQTTIMTFLCFCSVFSANSAVRTASLLYVTDNKLLHFNQITDIPLRQLQMASVSVSPLFIHVTNTHKHTVILWPSEHTQLSGDSHSHCSLKGHNHRPLSRWIVSGIYAELAEWKSRRAVRDVNWTAEG